MCLPHPSDFNPIKLPGKCRFKCKETFSCAIKDYFKEIPQCGKNAALCHGAMVWINGNVLCEMLMLRQGQIVRSSLLQLANAFSQNVRSS